MRFPLGKRRLSYPAPSVHKALVDVLAKPRRTSNRRGVALLTRGGALLSWLGEICMGVRHLNVWGSVWGHYGNFRLVMKFEKLHIRQFEIQKI